MESVFLRMRDVPSSTIFCSSLLPGICLVYFPKPFFISPSTPITTGIVVAFIPHIRSISISRSLYFDSFSVTLTEVFFLLLLLLLVVVLLLLLLLLNAKQCWPAVAPQALVRGSLGFLRRGLSVVYSSASDVKSIRVCFRYGIVPPSWHGKY